MSPKFETRVVHEDDAIVIYVSGEIDIASCERLRDARAQHGTAQTIILDLSGVEFMDSSSLPILVQARGALTVDGGSLKLRNPSVAAHRLLSVSGAEALLDDDAEQRRSG